MNGVHDMGGQQGFGPVLTEKAEPLFHADWESRAMAMTVAMGACGQWNIDLSRSARSPCHPPSICPAPIMKFGFGRWKNSCWSAAW